MDGENGKEAQSKNEVVDVAEFHSEDPVSSKDGDHQREKIYTLQQAGQTQREEIDVSVVVDLASFDDECHEHQIAHHHRNHLKHEDWSKGLDTVWQFHNCSTGISSLINNSCAVVQR